MLFFDVKKVLIAVAIAAGILAVVIGGFLYAGGFLSLDERDELYQGIVAPQYLTATAAAIVGEPIDEETIEDLEDTDNANGETSGDGGADDADAVRNIRVLLFFGSGEIAASGNISEGNDKFSLTKTVNMLNIGEPGDLPHMNRERDILTRGEVEVILADDGYFRLASGDKYISGSVQPVSS